MFDLVDCYDLMIDDLIQTEDDSKAKGKALELEKLLVAYVADGEALMHRDDDDVEMKLCEDVMKRGMI